VGTRHTRKHASIFAERFFERLHVKLFSLHSRMHLFLAGVLFYCFLFSCVAQCRAQSGSAARADAAAQAEAIYGQGMSALQTGDLVSARAAFEKVVRLAPQSPEGHNSLGWVLLAQGEIDPAISQFQIAVKSNPDFTQAHINFSNALARKGDVPGALREAKEAVRLAPED